MTVPQKVKEYFRFFEYLNQYSAEGIKFDFYTQTDGSEPIHNSFSINDEGDANLFSLNRVNETIDEDLIKKFIQRRYEDRKSLINEKKFINEELTFLNKFSTELQNRYEYQFKPLQKLFEEMADNGIDYSETIDTNKKKLKWKGTAAQFGYIMQELVGKGFIDKPTGSYTKDAQFYLEHFEIEGKIATLTKEISIGDGQNSLSATNRAMIKIPYKKQLR